MLLTEIYLYKFSLPPLLQNFLVFFLSFFIIGLLHHLDIFQYFGIDKFRRKSYDVLRGKKIKCRPPLHTMGSFFFLKSHLKSLPYLGYSILRDTCSKNILQSIRRLEISSTELLMGSWLDFTEKYFFMFFFSQIWFMFHFYK